MGPTTSVHHHTVTAQQPQTHNRNTTNDLITSLVLGLLSGVIGTIAFGILPGVIVGLAVTCITYAVTQCIPNSSPDPAQTVHQTFQTNVPNSSLSVPSTTIVHHQSDPPSSVYHVYDQPPSSSSVSSHRRARAYNQRPRSNLVSPYNQPPSSVYNRSGSLYASDSSLHSPTLRRADAPRAPKGHDPQPAVSREDVRASSLSVPSTVDARRAPEGQHDPQPAVYREDVRASSLSVPSTADARRAPEGQHNPQAAVSLEDVRASSLSVPSTADAPRAPKGHDPQPAVSREDVRASSLSVPSTVDARRAPKGHDLRLHESRTNASISLAPSRSDVSESPSRQHNSQLSVAPEGSVRSRVAALETPKKHDPRPPVSHKSVSVSLPAPSGPDVPRAQKGHTMQPPVSRTEARQLQSEQGDVKRAGRRK